MRPISSREFPEEVEKAYRRACQLEWVTLAYVASSAVLLYLTMGTSQAMRASFYEEVISFVPALAFLICTRIARLAPRPSFPYGMHRTTSIGHFVAALALCVMGAWLLIGAVHSVLTGVRATIGGVVLFDTVVWGGWPMLAALLYAGLPSIYLGRKKAEIAPQLHDKILEADANMMKADWMTETATAVGVIGIGFGVWWLDPLAAAVVSLDILKDGAANLRTSVSDLVDRRPETTDRSRYEDLPDRIRKLLSGLDWVEDAEVRMREEGHLFLGEAFIVPKASTADLVERLSAAAEQARALDWRVGEIVIMPVARLAPEPREPSAQRRT